MALAAAAMLYESVNSNGNFSAAGTVVHVGGSRPSYDLADLAARADAVAIIAPMKDVNVHWNSADNKAWADDGMGVKSHILRDQTVRVVTKVFGPLIEDQFLLRGFGGTVGDVTLVYEEEPELAEGHVYIAFLRRGDLRFREGSEESWVLLAQGHGLFAATDDDKWSNLVGLTIDQDDLDAMSAR